MKNLDKFYSMFSDLDLSYKKMAPKLGNPSKLEFLRKIYYTNNGNPITPKVKEALDGEFSSYDSVEKEKYTQIIEILDALELFFGADEVNEISSLNAVVLKSLTERSDLFVDKQITKEDIIKISSMEHRSNVIRMSSQDLFSSYGEVLSFSKMFRGRIITRLLKEDYLNKFLTVEPKTINQLVSHVSENDLIQKIIEVYPKLPQVGVVAFCDSSLLIDGKILGRRVKLLHKENDFSMFSYDRVIIVVV